LHCFVHTHDHGCPWDEQTPLESAEAGRLECLQYMRENNCPWQPVQCERAAVSIGDGF
jgi:hypothetical protein